MACHLWARLFVMETRVCAGMNALKEFFSGPQVRNGRLAVSILFLECPQNRGRMARGEEWHVARNGGKLWVHWMVPRDSMSLNREPSKACAAVAPRQTISSARIVSNSASSHGLQAKISFAHQGSAALRRALWAPFPLFDGWKIRLRIWFEAVNAA